MSSFAVRALEKEIIDLRPLTPEETASVYRRLTWVNRWLGGARVILDHLEKFSRAWKRGELIRILDVGSGASDIPAAVMDWAKGRRFKVHVVSLDIDAEALRYGRERYKRHGLSQVRASCFQFPFAPHAFDYAITSMFYHHLTDQQIRENLLSLNSLTKRGIIINDLSRSRMSYAGFWILSLFTRDPVFRHDGLLSIRRAFRIEDLEKLRVETGLLYLHPRKHPGGRVALAGEK